MKCSNCGKQIPFGGRVCPYCHAKKSGDKLSTLLATIIVLGIVGWAIHSCSGPGAPPASDSAPSPKLPPISTSPSSSVPNPKSSGDVHEDQAFEYSKGIVWEFLDALANGDGRTGRSPDAVMSWEKSRVSSTPDGNAFYVVGKGEKDGVSVAWETCVCLDAGKWKTIALSINGNNVFFDKELQARFVKTEVNKAKGLLAETERKRKEAAETAKWRTWTSADGVHTIDAKFVKLAGGMVSLEKRDGTAIEVPKEKLSEDDIDWITHRRWLNRPKAE